MQYLNAKNSSKTSQAKPSQQKKLSGKKQGAGQGLNTQSRKGETPTSNRFSPEDEEAIQRFLGYAQIEAPSEGGNQ